MDITRKIVEHLGKICVVKTEEQVITKIHNLVGVWKEAHLIKAGTAFGVDGKGTKDKKTLTDTIVAICKHWYRPDPVFRERAGMSAPFTGDSEDVVSADVFRNVAHEVMEEAPESSPAPSAAEAETSKDATPSYNFEVEDHRLLADKVLDGDHIPPDDEQPSTTGSASKKATKRFKSGTDSAEKKPKEESMVLVGALLASGKEKNDRSAARNEIMKRRFSRELRLKEEELKLQIQRQKDDHEVKMEELKIRQQEIDLRKAEMEFKRTEMLLELERIKQQRI